MKKAWLTIGMALMGVMGQAQLVERPAPQSGSRSINIPYQQPTYYQGNASYINNSMQNNKPAAPNAGPYTGNGGYVDPTRNAPAPAIINYNANQLPAPSPINNPTNTGGGNPANTNTSNAAVDKRK